MTTVVEQLNRAILALTPTSPSPRLDADVLLARVLRCSRSHLYAWPEKILTESQVFEFWSLVERRRQGEPIAYLTGVREFWSLPLRVTPATLIPRPETEGLVEQALLRIPVSQPSRVADLGTGSGAIALAIAHERPHAQIVATDRCREALAVAAWNAKQLSLNNVQWRCGDWYEALGNNSVIDSNAERFDIIVSNPPYVALHDPHLEQGDVRFEPKGALVAGEDGLAALRRISEQAPHHLRVGGVLLIEHGSTQREAVMRLLAAQGFESITPLPDQAGQWRMVVAEWAG